MYRVLFCLLRSTKLGGKLLHTRDRHLRTHRGFPVALSNGLSVACSNTISLLGNQDLVFWMFIRWGEGTVDWDAVASNYSTGKCLSIQSEDKFEKLELNNLGANDWQTRDRHLRNHRGFPVTFTNGLSVELSNIHLFVSCMIQRFATCQVHLYLDLPMDCQRHASSNELSLVRDLVCNVCVYIYICLYVYIYIYI